MFSYFKVFYKAQFVNFPIPSPINKKAVFDSKRCIMVFPLWHLNQCKNVSWNQFCGGLHGKQDMWCLHKARSLVKLTPLHQIITGSKYKVRGKRNNYKASALLVYFTHSSGD